MSSKKRALLHVLPGAKLSDKQFGIEFSTKVSVAKPKSTLERPSKRRKLTPNYFIAVPIENNELLTKIRSIQADIIAQHKSLSKVAIAPETMHITLFVTHLDEVVCIHDATRALAAASKIIASDVNLCSIKLSFVGLSMFKNEVLFVDFKQNEELEKLGKIADFVRNSCSEHGLPNTDDRPFKPHLTLFKLSKDHKTRVKLKKIPTACIEPYKDAEIGVENVTKLQLCSMLKPKQQNGYYWCPIEMAVFSNPPPPRLRGMTISGTAIHDI